MLLILQKKLRAYDSTPVILLEIKNFLKNTTDYNDILENEMLDKEENYLKNIEYSDILKEDSSLNEIINHSFIC
jgi:hypothetical protein